MITAPSLLPQMRLLQLPAHNNSKPVCTRRAPTGTWLYYQRMCLSTPVLAYNKRSGHCGAGLSYGSAAAEAGHSSSRADEEVAQASANAARLLALVTHQMLPAASKDVQLVICVSLEEASWGLSGCAYAGQVHHADLCP